MFLLLNESVIDIDPESGPAVDLSRGWSSFSIIFPSHISLGWVVRN